jgi:hypothetical protein
MILRSIWRIVVVSFAVLVSMLIAAAVLLTLGLERVTQALHNRDVVVGDIDGAANGVFAVLQLASAFTVLPALALIVVGEVARIRSALYYIIGGGAAMAAIPLLARLGQAGATAGGTSLLVWQVFATAGFAGGLAYWVLAGRRA